MSRPRNAPAAARRGAGLALKARPEGKRKLPDDPRGLADAVFARVDPVEIAAELLGESGDKRVKTQVLTLLLAYKFGKPAQRVEASGPGGGPVRVVWDIPRPARERETSAAEGER